MSLHAVQRAVIRAFLRSSIKVETEIFTARCRWAVAITGFLTTSGRSSAPHLRVQSASYIPLTEIMAETLAAASPSELTVPSMGSQLVVGWDSPPFSGLHRRTPS